MSAENQRKAYRYNCNMVRPQIYSEKSLMESVVDFFSDVVPQAYSTHKVEDKEKIQWVRFENCDCSDIGKNPDLYKYDTKGLPLLLILGYSNGVQIWHITPNGEALEILSVRQGPVKICRILPNPEPVLGYTDSFTSKRPLVVMCDSSSAGQPFCGMKFVSLKTGDEVHSTSFKTLPIHNIECNKRFLVVTFLEKICIYESSRFKQLFWITSCFPSAAPNVNPIALSTRWLAYADKRLVAMHQSCGGMSGDGTQSYAATVISAAKGAMKGLSMFGEAMVNSMTGCKPPGTKKPQDYVQLDNGNRPGIVTVVDIQNVHNDHFNVNEDNEGSGLIAHFHAHANEPVADMAFDPTGTLLVTACKLGHNFHIFRLMAHPCSSSLGAVHHLYTLHRGDTTAKVIDIGFNHDSRWVTVSTHRGTTHIFPITPYGGIPNVRTHCQPFVVNRVSRFHRSAGLEDIDPSPLGRRSPVLSTSPSSSGHYDRYPTLIQQNTLNNNMGNPRLPPYPHPITVYPLYQIKQPLNVVLNPGNKNMSPNHSPTGFDNIYSVTSKFCTPRLCVVGSPKQDVERREAGKRPVDCLFIMAQSGTLVEYVLEPRARAVSEKVSDESLLELNVTGRMQWNLQRLKTSIELRPPLPTNSPLILSHEAVISQTPTAPEYYDLPGLTRHDSKDSLSSDHSGKDEDEWVSQVEIITHAGPHRRLWMGPQFSFKTYQENTTVLSSNSSALLSQSTETNIVAMDITGEEGDLESLRVQPTRSNPVSMPNARPAYRRLSTDSSPSPGLSGHSAPLLIEAGSFDQSPHLLDVYSNWTESTVEKQPRGSDDMEEDRIKETLADAMVESPMRDMEKLSLRQDLSRANVRKVKADSDPQRRMVKQDPSSSAGKVKAVDTKAGKQFGGRKDKDKGVPVKSDSNVSNTLDKGRKKSLDKTLRDTKSTSSSETVIDDKMEAKLVQVENVATSQSKSSVKNEGKSQRNKNSPEIGEKSGHDKQSNDKQNVKDEVSQTKQNSAGKSNSRVSPDASITDMKAKNNVKTGKMKNKSKSDPKESSSIQTCSSASDTPAVEVPIENLTSLVDEASVLTNVKSETNAKGSERKAVSSASAKDVDRSTTNELEISQNNKKKKASKNKSKEVSEEKNIMSQSVSDFDNDAEAKTSSNSEPVVAKLEGGSKGKHIERECSVDKSNLQAGPKDIEVAGSTYCESRESVSPERVELQKDASKKQRKGKDKKKGSTNKSPEKNNAKSSKCSTYEDGLQNSAEEDVSNNHMDHDITPEKDKAIITDIVHKEPSVEKQGDYVVQKIETEKAPINEYKDGQNPDPASSDKLSMEDEKMDTSMAWCKPDKKKKKNKKNGKAVDFKMTESVTENMEGLSLEEIESISPFTANDKAECLEDDELVLGDEKIEEIDVIEEHIAENVGTKIVDIAQTDNQIDIISDYYSNPNDEKEKPNEIMKTLDMLYNSEPASNQKHCISEEPLDNLSKTDVKGKNKQKKKKKSSKSESTEKRKEFDDKMAKELPDNIKEEHAGSNAKTLCNENHDTEVSIEKDVSDDALNTDITEMRYEVDPNANIPVAENIGEGKKLEVGGLELNIERADTSSLERSPSFESVRSTLSEERVLPMNDGTDSEVLASTEQSDNDMIEVKSKKKKRKKKANIEESMYFEAVDSEMQLQEETNDPELDTDIPYVAAVELETKKDPIKHSSTKQKTTSDTKVDIVDSNQENVETKTEMFVVKSKKSRKNKSQNMKTSMIGAIKPSIEEPVTLDTCVMPTTTSEEVTTAASSDTTPVNSAISMKGQSMNSTELKVPAIEANPMAWETAGNVTSDESKTDIGGENDPIFTDIGGENDKIFTKPNKVDVKVINEICDDNDDVVKQDKTLIDTPETSNASSRSSEEKDVVVDKTKETRGESKTKKKRKKNKK